MPARLNAVVVRTAGDPAALTAALRRAVASVHPDIFVDARSLTSQIEGSLVRERLLAHLSGFLGGLAMMLACIGIYGVMAYLVTQRTQEIGVRMALGARKQDVLRLVVGKGMVLAVIGITIGLVASLVLTRLMRSLLFEVTPTDWLTFVIVSVVLLIVALLACYIPARRATKVDPLVALRYE